MSTTKKIAQNTIIQISGKIISTLLGIASLALMARYLGTEKFGWYVTTISFLQFIGIMADFGLIPVTAQMLSSAKIPQSILLKNLFSFRLVTSLIFFLPAPLIAFFLPYPVEVKWAILISTTSFVAIGINQIFIGFYQNKLQTFIQVIGEIISKALLLLGIWYAITFSGSFYFIMTLITLSAIIFTLIMWLFTRKNEKIGWAYEKQIWLTIIKNMWPLAISIIFNVVYLRGDVLILSFFVSQDQIGIYGAAYRVLDVITQTAMLLMGFMMPLLASAWVTQNAEEFKKRYQQSFDLLTFFSLPLVTVCWLLAPQIMLFVAGENFLASGQILAILSVALGAVYFSAVFAHAAVAIGKQKETMWVYISDAFLTLIGYLIFIPKFGLLGAASMTVFSEIYATVFLYLTVKKYLNVKLSLRGTFKMFSATIFLGIFLFTFKNANIILLTILGAILYLILIVGFKAISKQTILEIVKKS